MSEKLNMYNEYYKWADRFELWYCPKCGAITSILSGYDDYPGYYQHKRVREKFEYSLRRFELYLESSTEINYKNDFNSGYRFSIEQVKSIMSKYYHSEQFSDEYFDHGLFLDSVSMACASFDGKGTQKNMYQLNILKSHNRTTLDYKYVLCYVNKTAAGKLKEHNWKRYEPGSIIETDKGKRYIILSYVYYLLYQFTIGNIELNVSQSKRIEIDNQIEIEREEKCKEERKEELKEKSIIYNTFSEIKDFGFWYAFKSFVRHHFILFLIILFILQALIRGVFNYSSNLITNNANTATTHKISKDSPNNIKETNKTTIMDKNKYLSIQSYYHAKDYYTNVDVSISSEKPSVDKRKSARKLNDLALSAIKEGNYYDAITHLLQANKEDPSDAEILGNLGYAYQQTGDYKKSNFVLLRALELKPERSSSWFSLAQNYAELGNITAAHMAYKNTLKYSRNRDKTITTFEKEAERSENRAKALDGLM